MAEATAEITKSKVSYNPIDEIPRNRLDTPRVVKGRNGKIAFGTDEGIGYKPVNEDAIFINTKANVFASIDGMGGMGKGDRAAQILAQEIQRGVRGRSSIQRIISGASNRMAKEGVGKGGACYIVGHIRENILNIYQAGDVKLIVVGRRGNLRFETKDEGIGNKVFNSVQGIDSGEITKSKVRLNIDDKIVVASDGLWDNYSPQQIAKYVYNKDVKQAINGINKSVKNLMKSGRGKCDNINVIIYDFKRFTHSPR